MANSQLANVTKINTDDFYCKQVKLCPLYQVPFSIKTLGLLGGSIMEAQRPETKTATKSRSSECIMFASIGYLKTSGCCNLL